MPEIEKDFSQMNRKSEAYETREEILSILNYLNASTACEENDEIKLVRNPFYKNLIDIIDI